MTIAATRWATWLTRVKSHAGCGIVWPKLRNNPTDGEHFKSRCYKVWRFKAKSTRSAMRKGFTWLRLPAGARGARSLADRSLNDVL